MLVLARRKNEAVFIDVNGLRIEITVTKIASNQVKLGFDAPPSVKILRKEITDRGPK